MHAEDVTSDGARLAFRRQDHDYPPPRADVFHVAHQVLVLFDWPPRANHCSLQPLKYSMLCPCRIEATQVLLAIEYVDGVPIEASFHQCFNRGFGVPRVGDRANDTIGRVRDEAAFRWFGIHK